MSAEKTYPPSAYVARYEKACLTHPRSAENYIRHTHIGDPALDPVMAETAALSPADLHRFIKAGIERNDRRLNDAPEPLRNFFRSQSDPQWLDYAAFTPGIRAFHKNADFLLAAFVAGVLVEGFSTTIAKSFAMTGRVALTSRRLRQNNRQLLEIFYPSGLRPDGDGWKLSVRIRFVHARIRYLLKTSGKWDAEALGVPVHAANLGLAISVFSHRLLTFAKILGARFSEEEEASILAVWRYAGYLMGIPESILYTSGNEAERIYRIGFMCEPLPDADSAAMANALINSIPKVAKVTDPVQEKKTIALAYRVSRALIGNQLADSFGYPKTRVTGTLASYRLKQRAQRWLKHQGLVRAHNFMQMLMISIFDEEGVSYRLPDHIEHESTTPW